MQSKIYKIGIIEKSATTVIFKEVIKFYFLDMGTMEYSDYI